MFLLRYNTRDQLPMPEAMDDLVKVLEKFKISPCLQDKAIETGVFPRNIPYLDEPERMTATSRELEDHDLFNLFGMLMRDQRVHVTPGMTEEQKEAAFTKLEACYKVLRNTVKSIDESKYWAVRKSVTDHMTKDINTPWPGMHAMDPDVSVLETLTAEPAWLTTQESRMRRF